MWNRCRLSYFVVVFPILWIVSGFGALNFGEFVFLTIVSVLIIALASAGAKDPKPTYSLVLRTSSGEVKALESEDKEFIFSITEALNSAIVARG